MMLVVQDFDDDDFVDATETLDQGGAEETTGVLNAILGDDAASTLQVEGFVKKQGVVILIDTGSSHNVIHSALAKRLCLPSHSDQIFRVGVAGGRTIKVDRTCRALRWSMAGSTFQDDFIVLDVGRFDLILGAQWLRRLGRIILDMDKQFMAFSYLGHYFELHGKDTSLEEPKVSVLGRQDLQLAQPVFIIQVDSQRNDTLVQLSRVQELSSSQQSQLAQLLQSFSDVFEEPTDLPPPRSFDHRIILRTEQPVSCRPYRYGPTQKDEIERQIHQMLRTGIIQPSQSPFAAPVVLVHKKDGSWRFCVDYRRLNEETVKNKFPIPLIEDLLNELHGASFFSRLDLRAGYHQIRMHPPDSHKTAFRTHEGLYEFLVMPFDLTNAPATFQGLMNSIFHPFLRKFILVFFDDILVYSSDWDSHLSHLHQTLTLLRDHTLFAKASKCIFAASQVAYLGHLISARGVEADPQKLAAISSWPTPTSVKALRSFLGLTGYYRRFIQHYGTICQPLTALLQKNKVFHWSPEAAAAYDKLKTALTTPPVLALPNFDEEFIIEADASGSGIGAVLKQGGHPLAFVSKALSPRKQTLSAYERELIALIFAVQQWRSYLVGRSFTIRTDHLPLKHLLEQKSVSPEQLRWLNKLWGLSYTIEYRKGRNNVVADALSRRHEGTLFAISSPATDLTERVKASWGTDQRIQRLIHDLRLNPSSHSHYSWSNDALKRKGKLVVGTDSVLRADLLGHFHADAIGGHSGATATYRRLSSVFYWKGLERDVREFVRGCITCNRFKPENVASPGLLQPLPIPEHVWTDLSMDFICGLPKSYSKSTILVVVDRLSKAAHFMALQHPFTAVDVAQCFFDNVVKHHGFPQSIVTDRDPVFGGKFWRELFRLHGVRLQFSSAYHPQSDGQTEVLNRCLECYLRCMTGDMPKQWVKWLSLAELWYNTSYHSAIGMTPFQAVYGVPPPAHLPYLAGDSANELVDRLCSTREDTIQLLKHNLRKAQERMTHQANKHRTEREFAVGDMVFLKLQPFRRNLLSGSSFHKLAARYFGPFEVLKKIGKVAYELQLPPGTKIHPVFHVSLLKRSLRSGAVLAPSLPAVDDDGHPIREPFSILGRKLVQRDHLPITQVLIRWKNTEEEDATWEDLAVIRSQFPHFPV